MRHFYSSPASCKILAGYYAANRAYNKSHFLRGFARVGGRNSGFVDGVEVPFP